MVGTAGRPTAARLIRACETVPAISRSASEGDNGDAAALRQFLDFLRQHDIIPAEKVAPRRLTPVEQEARAFEHYLRDEHALARATCVNYVPFIRGFLTERFGRRPVTLSRLCAGDVVHFVQRETPRLHLKRAKLLTSALR